MIGFEQDDGTIIWYGYYPDGVHVETDPPDEVYYIDVTRQQYLAARKDVAYFMHLPSYWTTSYNCSAWVYDILFRAGIVPDIRDPKTHKYPTGVIITPRKLPTIIPSINGPYYAPAGKKKPKAGDYLSP